MVNSAYTHVYMCIKIRHSLSLKDFLHGQCPSFRATDGEKENYGE